MEVYNYNIYKSVYDDMKCGKKTVEFRLLNEKSEKIKIGDTIYFKVVDSDLILKTTVIDKFIYNDIDDLWNHKEVLNNVLNYTKEQFKSAFYEIFGKDNVLNSKIVGIKICVQEDKV